MKKLLIILSMLALVFPTIILAERAANCNDYCYNDPNKDLPSGQTCDCANDCDDYCDNLPNKYPPPRQTCICNPLASEDFGVIITNIINFIFNIAVVLAPLMIVIAGFLFVTAGGNLEQTKRAKDIIIWTAVGFFVILLARGIMGLIMNLLGVS